jgi:hypothetical protein
MTLVLVAANSQQIAALADGRLTSNGAVVEENAGKLFGFVLGGARFALGFTGLARIGSFDTRRWLLDVLWDSAEPNLIQSMPTLQRFRQRVSRDFARIPDLRRLAPFEKRTEFVFVGYGRREQAHPVLLTALVSNFRDTARGVTTLSSWSEFALSAGREALPRTAEPGGVVWAGAWRAILPRDVDGLDRLLKYRKPYSAIVNKATAVLMAAAARRAAGGTVNRRVLWLRVPASFDEAMESGHTSAEPLYESSMPDIVARTPGASSSAAYVSLSSVDRGHPPAMAIAKVHRHAPCPCKSGKRYKSCHGKEARDLKSRVGPNRKRSQAGKR